MDKKEVKYGIIGKVILFLLEYDYSRLYSKNATVSNYFSTTSRKQVFKDVWFVISLMGFVAFAGYIVINIDKLVVPAVTDIETGIKVEGNCDFVREKYKEVLAAKAGNRYVLPGDFKDLKIPDGVIVNITLPQPNMTCPTTPTLQCPDCICPAVNVSCPAIPPCQTVAYTGVSRPQIRAAINVKPDPTNIPAFSGGCYNCLRKVWSIMDIPTCDKDNPDRGYCVPRFNPAPATGYYQHLLNKTKPICTIDFVDEDCDGDFPLNNSIWAIFGNGSIKTIYKMDR